MNDLEIELTDEEKPDDAKAVRRVFDVLRARVLYTTRLAPDEFTRAGAMIRPLDLDRLPENQAVDLIRRSASQSREFCAEVKSNWHNAAANGTKYRANERLECHTLALVTISQPKRTP